MTKAGTLNSFGTKGKGTVAVIQARVQRQRQLTTLADGRQSEIRAVIYTDKAANIAREDLVTIDGEEMQVLEVQPAVHGDGFNHHKKVLAGSR